MKILTNAKKDLIIADHLMMNSALTCTDRMSVLRKVFQTRIKFILDIPESKFISTRIPNDRDEKVSYI